MKPAEVDEPVDVWVHRPLGYVVARLAETTSLTPNHITALSAGVGIVSGGLLFASFPGHLQVGASCLFLSQVLDCADGQLARLRRSSSPLGRMFDGTGDMLTSIAAGAGTTYVTYQLHRAPSWHGALALVACLLTIYGSQLQTAAYDHYKNVYVRMTEPGRAEGEDLEDVILRRDEARANGADWVTRAAFAVYVAHLTRQRALIRAFDPFTRVRLSELPAYSEEGAVIYRRHALAPMRLWRSLYGVGLLMFGIVVFVGVGRPDLLVALRLVGLNGVLWLHLGPLQRRASRAALEELSARVVAAK